MFLNHFCCIALQTPGVRSIYIYMWYIMFVLVQVFIIILHVVLLPPVLINFVFDVFDCSMYRDDQLLMNTRKKPKISLKTV
jgi:hypothetical protein